MTSECVTSKFQLTRYSSLFTHHFSLSLVSSCRYGNNRHYSTLARSPYRSRHPVFHSRHCGAVSLLSHSTTIPPGFTHDEAGHGHDAIAIAHGARPLYETVGYGREPLYDYVVAMFMPFFGENYLTLRIVSALAGLLLIVVMHFWVRRAFDVPTAIATSAFLATSFWAAMVSRQALRSALLPAAVCGVHLLHVASGAALRQAANDSAPLADDLAPG